jgi:hypothetical protein
MLWASKKMPPNKKSKTSISNSLKYFTLTKKLATLKSSNNSTKPIKPLVTPKNVKCMTSTALKEPEAEEPANKIC